MIVSVDGQELVDCVFPTAQRSGAGLRFEFGGPWFNVVDHSRSSYRKWLPDAFFERIDPIISSRCGSKGEDADHSAPHEGGSTDALSGRLQWGRDAWETPGGGFRGHPLRSPGRGSPVSPGARFGVGASLKSTGGDELAEGPLPAGETYLFLAEGSAIRLQTSVVNEQDLAGQSPLLGACKAPLASVRQLRVGSAVALPERRPPRELDARAGP